MITEQKTGENDLIIEPTSNRVSFKGNISDYQFFNSNLNFTKFKEIFKEYNFQASPRLIKNGMAWILKNSEDDVHNENLMEKDKTVKTNHTAKYIKKNDKINVDLYVMDLNQEKEIELGMSFPNIELKKDECAIHQNIARLLNLNKNNITRDNDIFINISIDLQPFLTNFLISKYYMNTTHEFNPNITHIKDLHLNKDLIFPCKVKAILAENFGKLNQEKHSTVIMEYIFFYDYISNFLNKQLISLFPDFPDLLKSNNSLTNHNTVIFDIYPMHNFTNNVFSSYDYADQIIVNFPKPRINSYLVANFDSLQLEGVKYANAIVEKFGGLSINFNIYMPIIKNIKPLFNGAIFLSIVLNIIIICLFGLSVLLIFSLLQISLETRIYEFGILQIIGSTKTNIIVLILCQCLTFSIPAFLLAYCSHIYILDFIQNLLSKVTETNLQLKQEFGSVLYSLVMTNLTPLVAAFFPIKSLFKNPLAYSLNNNISKTSGVKIEVLSAADSEKKSLIIFGFLVFLYGISIYYFLPLSMLSMNWGLLLFILLLILLGMLTGLIILSVNMEYIIQKVIVCLFFFWTQAATRILILKNLTAHRIRNRKTAIMYSLSVGFFILVDVGLKIELKSQELMALQRTGSYYQISGDGNLRAHQIFPTIYTMKKLNLIKDLTFITPGFDDVCENSRTALANLGKMSTFSVDLVGIPSNYFKVALEDFLKVDQEDAIDLDISEKLYLAENKQGMGISGIITWEADINLNESFFLNIIRRDENKKFSLIYEPAYILHSAPGVQMTAEPITFVKRTVLVSANMYLDLMNKCENFLNKKITFFDNNDNNKNMNFDTSLLFDEYAKFTKRENKFTYSYNDFPISRILFKLNFDCFNYTELFDKLADVVNYDSSYLVNTWSFFDYHKKLIKISYITSIIFNSVNFIILVFCFFNLSASMTINIKEQQKEISILRSIGLVKSKLSFIYQAEAFVLIFTACIIGILVGTLVSFTMTLQQVMFTNLPITFIFPYMKLVYLLIISILSGILSTFIPAKIMLDQSIANMLKTS